MRLAAAAGLSTAVLVGVVAPALAGSASAQTQSVVDCVNAAAVRITAAAVALPADQRSAYIRAQVEAARVRCTAVATTTSTTTTSPTTTTTTTSPTTTTTSPTTTTTTTSPTTTSTTTRPRQYDVVVTGVIGPGRQTLVASCDPGDQVVRYREVIGSPTGSNTSRSVSVSSDGRTVRVTYQVTGTVANPTTSLTVTCRRG